MNADKQPDTTVQLDSAGLADGAGLAENQSQIRIMIGRAVTVYCTLFVVCGVLMSALGLSPLVNGGLMPKVLLAFVGLAFFIALLNQLSHLSQEHGLSISLVARNFVRAVISPKQR